jgi:hypothetical protein
LTLLRLLLDSCSLELIDGELEELAIGSEPAVSHHTSKIDTLRWVRNQHLGQQVSRLCSDVLGERQGRCQDVLVEQVDVVTFGIGRVVVEWEVAGKHGIEDDTTRPDIDS